MIGWALMPLWQDGILGQLFEDVDAGLSAIVRADVRAAHCLGRAKGTCPGFRDTSGGH